MVDVDLAEEAPRLAALHEDTEASSQEVLRGESTGHQKATKRHLECHQEAIRWQSDATRCHQTHLHIEAERPERPHQLIHGDEGVGVGVPSSKEVDDAGGGGAYAGFEVTLHLGARVELVMEEAVELLKQASRREQGGSGGCGRGQKRPIRRHQKAVHLQAEGRRVSVEVNLRIKPLDRRGRHARVVAHRGHCLSEVSILHDVRAEDSAAPVAAARTLAEPPLRRLTSVGGGGGRGRGCRVGRAEVVRGEEPQERGRRRAHLREWGEWRRGEGEG